MLFAFKFWSFVSSALYLDARASEHCMTFDCFSCTLNSWFVLFFTRGGFHRDPRQIVQYKDLDAPDDGDAF